MNFHVKAALVFSLALLLAAINFAFVIAGHPQEKLLMSGMAISMAIGMVLGMGSTVVRQRFLEGRGILDVILTSGLVQSALLILYFVLLKALYKQGAFHLTLATGLVGGSLLVLSYVYARQAAAERRQH